MTARVLLPLLTSLLFACAASPPATELLPESDAGAILEPDRNVVLPIDGRLVEVTTLRGAEELEVVSPDGAWVAFVSGNTGLASVWAVRLPTAEQPRPAPIQLTNRGLEAAPRTPGTAPEGFVPVPESAGGLAWSDAGTITWRAQGRSWSVTVPR